MKSNTETVPNKSLYDITFEYDETLRELEEYFETADDDKLGEVPEEFIERLNINENELEHKLIKYYEVIQTKKGKIDFYKNEQKRLSNKRNALSSNIDYLTDRLKEAVELFGNAVNKKSSNNKVTTKLLNVTYVKKYVLMEANEGNITPSKYKKQNLVLSINIDDYEKVLNVILNVLPEGTNVTSNNIPYTDMKRVEAAFKNVTDDKLPDWLYREERGYLRYS